MLALYRSGRRAEALDIYRRSRDRLVNELGIEPGPELRSLASRVLNQDPSLGWTAPAASAGEVIEPTGAFVGRKRELADLQRGLEDIQRGHGSLFVISGEPGIGKTALTEQFAVRVADRNARVLSGRVGSLAVLRHIGPGSSACASSCANRSPACSSPNSGQAPRTSPR
jgi:Bacterial transcriptional activator domain/AAA ATPase domain